MRLHVERGAAGSAVRVRTRSSLLAPRILRVTPTSARVALVATTALLLAGDAVELDVVVGEGVELELVEVAATVAYAGRGGSCSWAANLTVAEGASLRWPGEPFVVATDARATRTTHADVADGGSLVLRDTLVLGRHGETGGELVARTDIVHAGRPALVEEFHLSPQDDAPGIRGGHRVVDQVTTIGAAGISPRAPGPVTRADAARPGVAASGAARSGAATPGAAPSDVMTPGPAAAGGDVPAGVTRLDLIASGHVDRWLGDDVHRSPLRS